nr:hypothetical protein [Tanacetum cinerariifolium]
VPAVRQILTNSTNTFSAAGHSNTIVSPTHEKSSYVDTSQYPDDPNMPALEDITYSDDEDDVGAEADFTNLETTITVTLEDITYSDDDEYVGAKADFTNLETTITVSPIPTTRVHKDNPMTQIISDLSLDPQTRSMTRMVKKQDPSWIEAMQEELLQFKLQKVWVLVDLPKVKRAQNGFLETRRMKEA